MYTQYIYIHIYVAWWFAKIVIFHPTNWDDIFPIHSLICLLPNHQPVSMASYPKMSQNSLNTGWQPKLAVVHSTGNFQRNMLGEL